jgi:hypothetical protein
VEENGLTKRVAKEVISLPREVISDVERRKEYEGKYDTSHMKRESNPSSSQWKRIFTLLAFKSIV